MPDENQANQGAVQAPPVQSGSNSELIRPPDADSSLDGALEKLFNRTPEAQPNENPTKNPEPPTPVKREDPKPESTPKQDKVEATGDSLPTPDQIQDSPSKNQQGWNSLKNNYKRAHKVISDKDQEIAKLKQSLSERGETSTKEVEDLKKQIEELNGYRAMVDIEADPEFSNKFDAPFKKNVESIKTMLGDLEVSEDIIKTIDFNDDFRLKQILGLVISNKGAYKPEQIYTYQKLKSMMEDSIDLLEKRDASIIEHKTKHKEYIENKKKESFTKAAESEGKIIKRLEEVSKNIPFLNKMTPKDGANQGEIDNVDSHNKMVDAMTQKIHQALKESETPEGRANTAIAAVAAHYLNAQLGAANKKIASLEGELKKISTVGSEGEKTRQTSSGPRRSPTNGNGQVKSVDDALSEHFVGRR